MSMKNSLTPAGIEPATFRFVAQHLDHCAHIFTSTNNLYVLLTVHPSLNIPSCIPDSRPVRITNTKCRINRVVSPGNGQIVAPKHVKKRNKHTKRNCAPSWLYLQDYAGMHGQQNKKKCPFWVDI